MPTAQTPQQTPRNKKLWVLITLVVLLLCATGVLGYKYYEVKQQLDNQQPTPLQSPQLVVSSPSPVSSPTLEINPTAGWKTYKNQKSSYSLRYPSDWKVIELDTNSEISRISFSKSRQMPFINVIHRTDITIDNYRQSRFVAGYTIMKTQIANTTGYKITQEGNQDGEMIWIVSNKSGELLELVGQYRAQDKNNIIEVYEKMAESFVLD